MKYKGQKQHNQHSHQQTLVESEPTVNNNTNSDALLHKIEPSKVMIIPPRVQQGSKLPPRKLTKGKRTLNGFQPDNNAPHHISASSKLCSKVRQLSNSEDTNERPRISSTSDSVTLTPNCAYKEMEYLKDNHHVQGSKTYNHGRNLPVSSSRQSNAEYSYDYPQLRFAAGVWQGKGKTNPPSRTQDSYATVNGTLLSEGTVK